MSPNNGISQNKILAFNSYHERERERPDESSATIRKPEWCQVLPVRPGR
jgi:hypothetical protein